MTLTRREARSIRFIEFLERVPWIEPLAIAFVWCGVAVVAWFTLGTILEHGGEFGLTSLRDLWALVSVGSESNRLMHPYEVFAIEQSYSMLLTVLNVLIVSVFLLAMRPHNRLVLKLWRNIEARPTARGPGPAA
jgi:hypothetical protein